MKNPGSTVVHYMTEQWVLMLAGWISDDIITVEKSPVLTDLRFYCRQCIFEANRRKNLERRRLLEKPGLKVKDEAKSIIRLVRWRSEEVNHS